MKLYQTPNGVWLGTEKTWKDATIAEGYVPKDWRERATIEVPVSKPELMDWLTFHHVNVINPDGMIPHSPGSEPELEEYVTSEDEPVMEVQVPNYTERSTNLDEMFLAAPLGQQLTLAGLACQNAYQRIKPVVS